MFPAVGRRSSPKKLASLVGIMAASAVFSAAACTAVVEPSVEGSGSVRELRVRWAQWRAAGPRSYSYELRRTCFCIVDAVTPARVEVRDGRVDAARAIETGQALPLELFEPIDSLFARAIEVAERGRSVEVRYHVRLSYPTWLEIGTLANDAGVRYEVSALVGR